MQANFNYIGFFSLYRKEVIRFIKVYHQTLIAPVVTSLIFLAIFTFSLSHHVEYVDGIPFGLFMASGLIIASMVQNAFANSSSTLIMGRVMGNYIDYIIPPFSSSELIGAMVLGGITRGFCVGILVFAAMYAFVDLHLYSLPYLILYSVLSCTLLALLGIFAGIFAENFDQMSAITNYLITPLSFLSGTFYSVKNLPPLLYQISHFNPFFYMIDGFRYSLTGYHEASHITGISILLTANIVVWAFNHFAFSTGYRIKP